jgi:molybdopterin-binding protein
LRLGARILSLEGGRVVEAHPENVMSGEVVEEEGRILFRTGGVDLHVPEAARGSARATVDPTVIVLSLAPPETSAKNVLEGRVTAVAEEGGRVRVTVDAGIPVVAYVTAESAEELSLTVGKTVWTSFKAQSVRVLR